MNRLPEAASWLALTYASGLKLSRIKSIVAAWCLEGKQPLARLFELSPADMTARLGIPAEEAKKLIASAGLIPEQATWLAQLQRDDIQLITRADPTYPRGLVSWLPMAMQPLLLFCQGDPTMLRRPSVALMGGRDTGEESAGLARDWTTLLAEEGLVVVSGLGKGVGQAVLDAALSSEGGQATAVLPMGINTFRAMPGALGELSAAAEQGRVLLVSPFHPEARFTEAQAIARNKLIVSLAEALFVVAAGEDSVVRDTVDDALRLGKVVYVWDVDPALGPGIAENHTLIHAGALPIRSPTDILDAAEAVIASTLERLEQEENTKPVPTMPPLPVTHVSDADVPYDSQAVLDLLAKSGRVPETLARRLRDGPEDQP
jgi:predicted Rossmann fold nucleotide-binding protein DprA/Smf involved in DNA uptake